MLLYINNSASSPTDRSTTRRPEEPSEQEPFKFLFSGLGISNDQDDVSGLVVPNPFLAFARDLDQVIWNAGEGISLADIPEQFTQAHRMDMVVGTPRETVGSDTIPASNDEIRQAPAPEAAASETDDNLRPGRAFPAARCRRTTSPPVRHVRMCRAPQEATGNGRSRRASRPATGSKSCRKRWQEENS